MLNISGIHNFEAEVEKTLVDWDLPELILTDPRTSLAEDGACVSNWLNFYCSTDVLLLDEPTNHLDIESIQWLENFLASSGMR